MVRASNYRVSKYDAKMVGDVVKNRFDAQKTSMVQQVTGKFGDLVGVEEAAKNLLSGWGVDVYLIPPYLAFARECYRISNTHQGAIALNEICIAHDKWATRNLNSYYLQQIAFAVADIDISSCT